MSRAKIFWRFALPGLVLLSACGTSATSQAEFTAKAKPLCRAAGGETAPLVEQLVPAAESLSVASDNREAGKALEASLRGLHTDAANLLERLGELTQPTGAHSALTRFLAALGRVTRALAQAAEASTGDKPAAALSQLNRLAPEVGRLDASATESGLADCSSAFSRLANAGYTEAIHASLRGENHDPIANRPWRYTVTVSNALGQKLSGTETTEYTFAGAVVGTEKPTKVRFSGGVYRDRITFPAAAIGHPLKLQAVVRVASGTVTLDWPITVTG